MRHNDNNKTFIKNNVNNSKIISFIFDELNSMTRNIVVKLDYRARKYETEEMRNKGTEYTEAIDRVDVFESYNFYEGPIIQSIGLGEGTILSNGNVVTKEMYENFCTKPYTIPREYRQLALEAKRKHIIDNYVEYNQYYRELNGLPPYDENPKNFVYLKYRTPSMGDIDLDTPLHEYPRDILIKMNISGELDSIIEEHPTKRYLRHLLDLKIPFNISRKASNYAILYLNKPKHHELLADRFIAIYMRTVAYVKDCIYDPTFRTSDTYYDAFIGMFILTITIQRFIVNYFKSGIKREFFSKEIIKMYMDSYGIPFYSDISLTYLTKIAKNLNLLLLYKSTDQIFVDIFELFGMKDSKIYKYFLLKERKMDKDGNPIFATKTVLDDYGEQQVVDDLEKMYELRFVSIPSDTKQLSVDIIDKSNYIDYDLVVEDDVMWGGDGDRKAFLNEVLKSEFNYVETKYISMTSKYEISKMGFELCYFFKMIEDLKPEEENLQVVTPLGSHKLFDVFVAMFGLASMQMHFDGNIMDTNSKVLHVLGFNFEKDKKYIDKLVSQISTTDNIVIQDKPDMFKSKADLLNYYFDNRAVHDNLIKNRRFAKTIEEWNAYNRLYKATLITQYSNEMYRLKDGTIAKTYLQYLEEHDVNLYKFLYETTDEAIVENLDNVLIWLDEYFKSDKFDNIFLNIPTLSLDSIKRFIYYLVDIFKSYTVDLISMNVIYHMGDKYSEIIKILTSSELTADMENKMAKITLKDANEYPYPLKMALETFIKLRDEKDYLDVNLTDIMKIALRDAYENVTVTSFDNSNKYPTTYIFENAEVKVEKQEHDNIKLKDYLYIEEVK